MKFLSTSTCLCCINLRIGGLIMGYVFLAFIVFQVVFLGFKMLDVMMLISVFWGSWIYGIYAQRCTFMIPILFTSVSILFIFTFILILMPIVGFINSESIQSILKDFATSKIIFESIINCGLDINSRTTLILVWLVFLIHVALFWHFAAVAYSLYKSIEQSGQRSDQHMGTTTL